MENRHYLKWIRTLPCAITGRTPVQAHHEQGSKMKGISLKANDFRAMPLHPEIHRELHDIGHKTWEEKHGISQESIIIRTLEIAIATGVLKVVPEKCK